MRGGREVRRGEEWRGQGKRRFDEREQGGRRKRAGGQKHKDAPYELMFPIIVLNPEKLNP